VNEIQILTPANDVHFYPLYMYSVVASTYTGQTKWQKCVQSAEGAHVEI